MHIEYCYTKALFEKAIRLMMQRIYLNQKYLGSVFLVMLISWGYFPLFLWPSNLILQIFYILTPLLFGVIPFRYYQLCLKHSKTLMSKLSDPTVNVTLSEENFHIRTDIGNGQLQWKSFAKLWKFKEMWLLFPNEVNYYVLPVELLTEEMKQFIEAKLKEHTIKIQ